MKGKCSLHIRHFSVDKRDLNILVNIDLLGAQIDDLVRLADGGYDLIGGLPLFNLLRRWGRLLLRLRLSLSCTLVASLLVVVIAALLSAALIAGAIIEREESGDCIFDL